MITTPEAIETMKRFAVGGKGTLYDYYLAPFGEGPLVRDWEDRPDRLLHDVLTLAVALIQVSAEITKGEHGS